jgi:hypothetical protein
LSNKLRDFSLFNGIGETGYSGWLELIVGSGLKQSLALWEFRVRGIYELLALESKIFYIQSKIPFQPMKSFKAVVCTLQIRILGSKRVNDLLIYWHYCCLGVPRAIEAILHSEEQYLVLCLSVNHHMYIP